MPASASNATPGSNPGSGSSSGSGAFPDAGSESGKRPGAARAAHRLAVILARAGSKRLPGKNLRLFHGRPLFAWGLEAALTSGEFARVLVSTDSPELADQARERGAWVPFLRPDHLAGDTASSLEALLHAVEWVQKAGQVPELDTVCLIQPTSPLLLARHLNEAVRRFDEHRLTTLGSMCRVRERPEWMFKALDENRVAPLDPERIARPSSDFPDLFRENGAFYLMRAAYLLARRELYDFAHHGMYEMTDEESVDIDTLADWQLAEVCFSRRAAV